jgi:hypothetical protein
MTYDPDQPAQKYLQTLEQYLTSALDKVREQILHPKGGTPASIEWNRNRALIIEAQIQRELMIVRKQINSWAETAFTAAAKQGWAAGQRQLAIMSLQTDSIDPALNASFAHFNMDTVRAIAQDSARDANLALDATQKGLSSTLRTMADNGLTAADVNQLMAGRIIEGKPGALMADLRTKLRAIHGDTITFASGRTMAIGGRNGYARMLARTRLREAAVIGRHQRLVTDGVHYVTIIGRVTIYPCTRYLGKIYYIGPGEDPEGRYPNLNSLSDGRGHPAPPFHPNCSKTTAPIVLELATHEQLQQGQPNQDSETPFGELKPMTDKGMVRVYERQANIADSIREEARKNGYEPPPWCPSGEK